MHKDNSTKVVQLVYFVIFYIPSDEKPRRLRAQTSVDVKALAQVLEAQGEFINSYMYTVVTNVLIAASNVTNCINSLQVFRLPKGQKTKRSTT